MRSEFLLLFLFFFLVEDGVLFAHLIAHLIALLSYTPCVSFDDAEFNPTFYELFEIDRVDRSLYVVRIFVSGSD